jgi:hypothetical protein
MEKLGRWIVQDTKPSEGGICTRSVSKVNLFWLFLLKAMLGAVKMIHKPAVDWRPVDKKGFE